MRDDENIAKLVILGTMALLLVVYLAGVFVGWAVYS